MAPTPTAPADKSDKTVVEDGVRAGAGLKLSSLPSLRQTGTDKDVRASYSSSGGDPDVQVSMVA